MLIDFNESGGNSFIVLTTLTHLVAGSEPYPMDKTLTLRIRCPKIIFTFINDYVTLYDSKQPFN